MGVFFREVTVNPDPAQEKPEILEQLTRQVCSLKNEMVAEKIPLLSPFTGPTDGHSATVAAIEDPEEA